MGCVFLGVENSNMPNSISGGPSSETYNKEVICNEGYWGGGTWTCTQDLNGNFSYKGKECEPITYDLFNSGSLEVISYDSSTDTYTTESVDIPEIDCDLNGDGLVNSDDKFPDHSLVMVFDVSHPQELSFPISVGFDRDFIIDWGDEECSQYQTKQN